MSKIFEELKDLLTSASEASRKGLLIQLHELIVSVESPAETASRIALYPAQTAVAKIGQDLKIFETLVENGPKSLEELQTSTNAHPVTLGRLLRYMASVGLVRETGPQRFEANKKCQNLATPEAVTILTHFFLNCSPLFQEMPAFLGAHNYQDVTDGNSTVFQKAYRTDMDTYQWFSQHPEHKMALIRFMGMEQAIRGRWLREYPFESETKSWNPEAPVFVDIGGNVGHYCALFKSLPSVPGRVILQDLPATIAQALPTPGVETVGHDFFKLQPVQGSKYYHLGWVLHNWNDERSAEILRQIKPAMTEESVILINDMVLPEFKVPAFAATLDLVMLGACGSRERTMKEWEHLLGGVGLLLKECIMYDPDQCHGIICATLK
ncbi:S-adenosyl-L-methionine-dependent methyltransferase [Xylaria telfairii]|nr:S-adenosyl-L-methionine-dependent methyltransferase [Xylaria telfairii]